MKSVDELLKFLGSASSLKSRKNKDTLGKDSVESFLTYLGEIKKLMGKTGDRQLPSIDALATSVHAASLAPVNKEFMPRVEQLDDALWRQNYIGQLAGA